MINFKDLSPEDQEYLLNQARQIVGEENINKHGTEMLKLKKKEHTDNCIDEICLALDIHPNSKTIGATHRKKCSVDKNAVRTRYISMVNYLFKANVLGVNKVGDHYNISNVDELNKYVEICNMVKEVIIKAFRLGKDDN